MNTQSTVAVASVPTLGELLASLPIVIFARAVREALGPRQRAFVGGRTARA